MRKVRCFIILAFMLGMATAQSSKYCKTPDSEEGVCVVFQDCPILLSQLDEAVKNKTVKNYLHNSFCGYDGNHKVQVCCPSKISVRSNQNVKKLCTTPDSKDGVCVQMYDCPMLLSLVPKADKNVTVKTFLQQSFCGFDWDKKPQVCCFFDRQIEILRNRPIKNDCKTPDSEPGVCIDIYDCPMLLSQVITQYNNSATKNFLRQSSCGLQANNSTKVCCSLTGELSPLHNAGITEVNSNITIRTIGGQPSELGAWPWMAALGYRSMISIFDDMQWNCGGTLITNRHVLTAAHCAFIQDYRLTTVRLGDLDLNPQIDDGASPMDVPIHKVLIHRNYNRQRLINDIALVKLSYSVAFTHLISPIKVPTFAHDLLHQTMYVIGWGNIKTSLSLKSALQEVEVTLVPTNECNRQYSKKGFSINNNQICAGSRGKDSCMNDSGGPLMLQKNNLYILVGIVSYGPKICGTKGYPGVYTNVASYSDWILENMISM